MKALEVCKPLFNLPLNIEALVTTLTRQRQPSQGGCWLLGWRGLYVIFYGNNLQTLYWRLYRGGGGGGGGGEEGDKGEEPALQDSRDIMRTGYVMVFRGHDRSI